MNEITLSELPQPMQTILNQAQITGNSLTITSDGVHFAVIQPIKKKKRAPFGAMKHRGKILGDIVESSSNLVNWDI
jgi:antitoxin (DNA-binding transcriptional repressor) of toxin-antitoxin stability system